MENTTTKSLLLKKEGIIAGQVTLDELSEVLGIEPDELKASLDAENVPYKAIGSKIFIKYGVAKQFILTPNFNNPKKEKKMNPQALKNNGNEATDCSV
jgi:hypothetical protein